MPPKKAIPASLAPPSRSDSTDTATNRRAKSRSRSPNPQSSSESTTTATNHAKSRSRSPNHPIRSKLRPRPSIANETDPAKQIGFNQFLKGVAAMVKKAKADGIDGYDEVATIIDAVGATREIVSSVDKYRRDNPNLDVKAVSFSKVSDDDLVRIGLGPPFQVVVDSVRLLSAVRKNLASTALDTLEAFTPPLITDLQELRDFVSTKNEPGARMIINRILVQAARVSAQEGTSLFLRVELRLSPYGQTVKIINGQYATLVSGLIDYGIGGVVAAGIDKELNQIQESTPTIENVVAIGDSRKTFVILEAKNDDEDLLDHLPQVICQCMALPYDIIATPSLAVSFGLANSYEWIFGVVQRGAERMVYRTDPLSMSTDGVGVATILKTLVYWASTESSEIHSMMQGIA